MGYFEEKQQELYGLLTTVLNEKKLFETAAKHQRELIDKEKEDFNKTSRQERKSIDDKISYNLTLEEGVKKMARERQIGFPWLANAYDELFKLKDKEAYSFLKNKNHPAFSSAEFLKEQSSLRRKAEKEARILRYIIDYYESVAPFLIDLKEEVEIPSEEEKSLLKDYTDDELEDSTTQYLTKEEYRKLPSYEKNQLALDRFWERRKSKWLIGRLYERYIGYLYEQQGYNVDYVGIFKGFEDLGRDLICRKGNEFIVIQCKNWSKFRTIYEKHIFQFFGTVFQYRDENPNKSVHAIFYTSTSLSELARKFAKELNIELMENFKFDKTYPSIKCNISIPEKNRIYHLPFDQQYDRTKIVLARGEFYCRTTIEAEDAGFRRAFRYKGN